MLDRVTATRLLVAGLFAACFGQACLDWSSLENGACGDGFVGREEACDDGNRISGDGCSDVCKVEPPFCGNGRLDPGEDCDDANDLDDDACVAGCQVARCGDGLLWDLDEHCDDGNLEPGDGCSPECAIEMVEPGPRCGDGKVDLDEACDDGNQSDVDRCLRGCSWATCGDGRVRAGVEECDDMTPGSGCSPGCLACSPEAGGYSRDGTNFHCYTLHQEAVTQSQARETCQAEGGDLWTATSEMESEDVAKALALQGRYWLGLLTVADRVRSWVTGENIAFTEFAPGEPRDRSLHCVLFDSANGGVWLSEACSTKLPFVCERAPAFVSPIDRHAYRLYTGALEQAGAKQRCVEEGGKLLALETDAERQFVGKQLGIVVWLDATEVQDGQFQWPDGQAVDSGLWGPEQPDDVDGSQTCLMFNPGDRYADSRCSDPHAYVCEIE